MGVLGTVSAYAQTPTFSAPTLPPIPGIPGSPTSGIAPIPSGPGIVSPPVLETTRVENPPAPSLSDLTAIPSTVPTTPDATANKPAPAQDALADLPPPVAPESGDTVGGALPAPATTLPEITADAEPAPATPELPVPATAGVTPPPLGIPGAPTLPPPPGIPSAGSQPVPPPMNMALPAVSPAASETASAVESEPPAPARKTWMTTLAPVSKAYSTKFNYRRAQLPASIYRPAYDRENSHLPPRVTREDYVKLLFESAATNNIDGTRALLNAGTDMNATNPRGETPLAVARRYGAVDTAALLAARGAR